MWALLCNVSQIMQFASLRIRPLVLVALQKYQKSHQGGLQYVNLSQRFSSEVAFMNNETISKELVHMKLGKTCCVYFLSLFGIVN